MTGMSKARRPAWILPAALALAATALAAFLLVGERRRNRELSARLATLQAENREGQARLEALARENETFRRRLAELGEPQVPLAAAPVKASGSASNLEQTRLLVKVQGDLAAAQKAVGELQGRLEELQAALNRAAEESQRRAASEQELREKLAGEARVLEALQAELKAKSDRLVQLEASDLLLRKQQREVSDKMTQTTRLLRELEELNRRREAHLAGLSRRYRELTEQLRTLAVRPEAESRALDAAELARMQNAVAAGEEDLRQLESLNAQAARLQRRIAGQ